MPVFDCDDLADPRLAPYQTLQRQEDHRRAAIFVAEGPTVVERLLRSPLGVVSALVARPWLERLGPLLRARADDPAVFVAPVALVERITGFAYHQGILAVGRCPPEPVLDDVIARAPRPRLVVALDGVTGPDNVGGILRTASALGVAAVLAGERAASPFLRRAVRVSMGGVLSVPVVHAADLAAALARLAGAHGVRVVAAEAHGGRLLGGYTFPEDACIVLGHEFDGLSPAVRAVCGDLVTIPMSGDLDSLNVASAGAVLMWEFRRQHPQGPP